MLKLNTPGVRRLFSHFVPVAITVIALARCGKQPGGGGATASSPGAGGAGAASEPVRIGFTGAFTGGSSAHGIAMRDSVRLAAEEINNTGGVLGGRKVELVERDDQGNNERGAQVMQDLINSQKVVAVLGTINTGVAQSSFRYPVAAKVPYFINVGTGAEVNEHFKNGPDNYVFGLRANELTQSEVIAAEAVDKRGFKKVAIMADDTNYGQNGRDLLEKALARRGVTAVSVSKFKIASAQGYDSFNLLIQAINQAGSADGPKIKEALENLQRPYEGVIGVFDRPFSATEHEAIKKELVSVGMIQEGRVVPAGS